MTDIGDRLLVIRDHLRTGAVGQREVWEEWLAEAADELDQLFWSKAALQTEIERVVALNDDQQKIMDGTERRECEYLALIEQRTAERNDYEAEGRRHIKTIAELRHENARLQALLKAASHHVESEGDVSLLTDIRRVLCPHGFPTREDCPACQHFDKVRNSETC